MKNNRAVPNVVLSLLIALLVLGIVAVGCAPAVTEEAVEEAPPAVVEEEEPEEPPVEEEEPVEEILEPERLELRINAGGPEVTLAGATWLEDQHFTGGRPTTNDNLTEIISTESDEVYLTARVSDEDLEGFSYAIPVPAEGRYEVRLHFAEVYWGAPGAGFEGGDGSRVFSVFFEGGAVAFTDYDIHAEVGAAAAAVKAFEVPVTDGTLDIVFTATVNRPKVSGIEVFGPLE